MTDLTVQQLGGVTWWTYRVTAAVATHLEAATAAYRARYGVEPVLVLTHAPVPPEQRQAGICYQMRQQVPADQVWIAVPSPELDQVQATVRPAVALEPISADRWITVQLDLDEIQARADAATPGPWIALDTIAYRKRVGDDWLVATGGEWLVTTDHLHTSETRGEEDDFPFIAAARTDVPALVAEVRRLRARVAELENSER